MNIKLDMNDAAKATTVEIAIIGLRRFRWRTKLAGLLIWLAALVAPFKMHVVDSDEKPCLLYCPYCGRDNAFTLRPGVMWPDCKYCGRQFMVRDWEVVKEPPDCGCDGCGYQEPYGWVAEAGCPVHDPEDEG